jgi:hypothetical protein
MVFIRSDVIRPACHCNDGRFRCGCAVKEKSHEAAGLDGTAARFLGHCEPRVANTGLVGFATAVVDGTLMALKRAEPQCGLASDRVAPGPAGASSSKRPIATAV